MKKVMKKSLSVIMIVVLCFTMVPLQGLVGLDISSWFASEAKAAVITESAKAGVFTGFEKTLVVILNGPGDREIVSSVIIGGYEYNIEQDLISIEEAKNLIGKEVVINISDGEVDYIKTFDETDFKAELVVESFNVYYKDGIRKKKTIEFEYHIYNSVNFYNETYRKAIYDYCTANNKYVLQNLWVTMSLPNEDVLCFKDGLGTANQVTFPLDGIEIAPGTGYTSVCKIKVQKQHTFDANNYFPLEIMSYLDGDIDGFDVGNINYSFHANLNNEVTPKESSVDVKLLSVEDILNLLEIEYLPLYRTAKLSGGNDRLGTKYLYLANCIDILQQSRGLLNVKNSFEVSEFLTDFASYLISVENATTAHACEKLTSALFDVSGSELEKINNEVFNFVFDRDKNNDNEFRKFIEWCKDNYIGDTYFKITNKCPTDIIITDANGELMLQIINSEIEIYDAYVYASVSNNEKTIFLPTDTDYNIEIIATDDGTMDYSVTMYTPAGLERTIEYNDVPLVKDEVYMAVAPCESMSETETYNLVSETGEEIEADYDSLPPVEDNIVDVIVAEELFDGFPVEIIDLVADTMFNMKSVVDLSAYDISTDDSVALFSAVAKYYPAEYSLIANSDFTYKIIVSPNLDRIMKIRFYYGDDANLSTYQKRVKDLNAEIDALVAKVEGMNEFEKALYIHDYIVLNSEYDLELLEYMEKNNFILPGELRSEKYTEYSILVNGTGVCGSYALAYRAVLNAAGMECLYLSSSQMNHAWNLVKIDGKWYHVDCCWDDPTPDTYGRARRTYFLRTDKEIMDLNHYSWTPGQYKANSEKYSDMPRNYDIKQKYDDGKWYYLEGTTLYSSDEYGKNETEIASISASSIDVDEGIVYFSNGRYIYEYNIETEKKEPVYMLSKKASGDNPADAYLSNIHVDDESVEFYKSVHKDDKRITVYDTDTLQREKFSAITGIEISNSEVSLDVFETLQLSANIITSGIVEDLEVEWQSSDSSIVKIDDNGKITAANVGSATIFANVLDYESRCEVTVIGDGLSGMEYDGLRWSYNPITKELYLSGSDVIDILYFSKYAFYNEMEMVTFGEGVTYIGSNFMPHFNKIKSIKIGKSVTNISDSAFEKGHSIESIVVDDDNECYSSDENGVLFNKNKTSLIRYPSENDRTLYEIPDTVQSICEDAFYDCSNLESIIIPDSVTDIDDYAFYCCYSLKRIIVDDNNRCYSSDECGVLFNKDKTQFIVYPLGSTLSEYRIPSSITTIGNRIFNCDTLKRIEIHSNVTTIDIGAFDICRGLEYISVDENNIYYSNDEYGVLFNKEKTMLIQFPFGSTITEYTIPKSVETLAEGAFKMCGITKVIVPGKVSHITNSAFEGCESLKHVVLHYGITSIGDYSFRDCISLEKIELPNSVVDIGDRAFYYCETLQNITIPNSVVSIKNGAFGATGLINVVIPKGIVELEDLVFSFCRNLTSLVIPNSVNSIARGAFYGCSKLEKIFVENPKCEIGDRYFWSDDIEFDISESVIIYGYTGSSAQVVAEKKGNKFIAVETEPHIHEHFLMDYIEPTKEYDGHELWECYCRRDSNKTILHYYGEEVTTTPSCVIDGYKSQTCLNCGEVNVLETIPATGKHDYKHIATVPGNCTTAPVYTYECTVCKDSYTKTGNIDDGHSYVETVIAPTCTEKGYTTAICSVCDETIVYDFTSPLGHKFAINRSAGQCTAHGTLEYSCKNCEYTELIAADTTELVTETVTIEPTCTKNGTKSEICTLCGATVSVKMLNPLSHEYSEEYTVDVEASCTSSGQKSQHCIRCDAKRAVTVIGATGHQNTGVINAADATCTNNGYTGDTYCSDCKTVIATGESLSKLSHQYVTVVTEPTCNSKGFTTHTCTACGDSYTDTETAIISHSYSSVVTPVTCTSNGYTTHTCIVCSHSYTSDTVTSTGHNYNDNGICVGCGKNRTENCSHICHKSGFMGFIWKIVRFFWKLFKMNPICECGVAHY